MKEEAISTVEDIVGVWQCEIAIGRYGKQFGSTSAGRVSTPPAGQFHRLAGPWHGDLGRNSAGTTLRTSSCFHNWAYA